MLKLTIFLSTLLVATPVFAGEHPLLQTHCGKCHTGDQPSGDFSLSLLGHRVDEKSREWWLASFDYVKAGDMPPSDQSKITAADRKKVASYLKEALLQFKNPRQHEHRLVPRRLNNREFANSVASVLMIEDVGTHQPLGNLLGDSLHQGFDTNGDALGISEYHLEQYIDASRKIVDAVILSEQRPPSRRYLVPTHKLRMSSLSQRTTRKETAIRTDEYLEFTDPRLVMSFENFQSAPASGWYRIKIRATGIDRGYYDSEATGIYDDDPIQLRVQLGDRHVTYDLPDNEVMEIELNEWLAEGTHIQLAYPTDGLKLIGNGNFKFQNRIAHDHIKKHDPQLYDYVVQEVVPKAKNRSTKPSHWVHWVKYWRGPRPRVFDAEVEGPFYESWPPKRQVALVGKSPTVNNAEAILQPIAERAWRREVRDGELAAIVDLVRRQARELGEIESIKEGIVAILVTPSFLLVNSEEGTPADRFASKLSFFLRSSPPNRSFRKAIADGQFDDFDSVRELVQTYFSDGEAEAFLNEFPYAWLQLDRINFMAPDPDHYHHYHRKDVSEDMIAEATTFFRDAVENNIPLPAMLTADYSFVNADLAKIYGIEDIASSSKLRKYQFKDGRRGGLLGMGAFLTLTADSLGTSPIHRAVYVLENFLGTKPAPPPGDVEIPEPDVRSARTIKEVLQAHTTNETCASCHRSIDPYGYAFENFDPAGGWRDVYVQTIAPKPNEQEAKVKTTKRSKPKQIKTPIETSATFRNGNHYDDIVQFRQLMKSEANQERFVRCFIKKLLLYANGEEPEDFAELDKILETSAKHDYRIVETIAAVVDSPLFRGQ